MVKKKDTNLLKKVRPVAVFLLIFIVSVIWAFSTSGDFFARIKDGFFIAIITSVVDYLIGRIFD